jgi:molybdopterin/thiamine biosynthesis adenylyltransferase
MADNDDIFSRQLAFWGAEKQQVLARSSLMIAGVGGVGSEVAEILVRCGVGKLILVDNKTIDPPDLSRQTLYTLDDLGKPKALAAVERLSRLTGRTELVSCYDTIDKRELQPSMLDCNGWLDCLDNFKARFALEDHLPRGMFMVHGALRGSYGQATTIIPGVSVSLQKLYASVHQPLVPNPVAAPIVYCLAVIMAQEAMHNLWGVPKLVGEMIVVDMNSFLFQRVKISN